MSFVHLQVRSAYSLLSSSIKIKELVDLALENQMSCLALVEEGTMHSAIKFYNACRRVNVKPLIGMSVNVQGDSFIDEWVILARNQCGYQRLLKIASFIAKQEGVVLYEQVLPFVQDLVVITSGEHGMLCSGIEEYKEERLLQYYESYLKSIPHLYIGLMRVNQRTYELSKHLISFASNVNRPIVALNDVRYLKKEDAKTLTLLQAIKQNQSVEELPLVDYERYFKSECQMKELFADVPNALMQTEQIANDCEVEIPLHQSLLPKYQTPEGVSSDSYLEALCFKGLEKRYGHLEYANRLKYELSVIHKMGFSDYFLIVWDFVRYAKSHDIYVGPGRGSAAGSLVAYVLGITNVDPIKYELLFERFLNPERITMPDIDIDFQDNRRDEVIQYVQNKYGSHCVVQIATFGTFQSRSAWRDLARVHQVETTLINKVASFIYSGSTLKEIYEQTKGLRDFFSTYPKLEAIYKEAEKIEGLPRHTSIHAAGVIISDHDLTDYTAIMEGPTGIYVSQYEAEDLEMIGLLKMDFLGLKI